MALVIDASVALTFCFTDEASDYADEVLASLADQEAIAPPIWPLEATNGLVVAHRRGRLPADDFARASAMLRSLRVRVVSFGFDEVLASVFALAQTHSLTAYDASYLHLALREGAPLATLDERLRAAARSAGCRVFEPADP